MAIYDKSGNALTTCYDKNGSALAYAYDVNGDAVFVSGETIDYDSHTIESYLSLNVANTQGFDIFDNVLFQFRGGTTVANVMNTYDVETGSALSTGVSIDSEHGNTASFSDEFYDVSDRFPLLYVSNNADSANTSASINRVTTSSATLIKTLVFPIADTGYYAHPCYDFDNDLAYVLGYTENSNQDSDGGVNKTIVTIWDLSDLTDNGDGTYTPTLLSSYQIDFIYVIQGQQFHDGMMWLASGYINHAGYIYALEPTTGAMLHTIDLNTTTEVEGLAWVDNYHMVVGFQGGTYKMVTFGAI